MENKKIKIWFQEVEFQLQNGTFGKIAIFISPPSNDNDPKRLLDWAIEQYVKDSKICHNVFIDSELSNPWMKVLLCNYNGLKEKIFNPSKHQLLNFDLEVLDETDKINNNVQMIIQESVYDLPDGKKGKLAIFQSRVNWAGRITVRESFKNAISEYVGDGEWHELIDANMDDPYTRVVLSEINDIPLEIFDPLKHKISNFKSDESNKIQDTILNNSTFEFFDPKTANEITETGKNITDQIEEHFVKHDELEKILMPVREFLRKHYDPYHTKMIIDHQSAEIIQGTEYFKKENKEEK